MTRQRIDESTLERMGREFIRTALGGPDTELSALRERNLRAYNATPDGEFAPPDIEDRSTFVSSDVADVVDGMLPAIMEVFVSDENAVECRPKKPGPEAAAQARQATGYLNHLFYVRNDGLNILHDWLHDAATQKVGFVKVWAEEEAEDSKQSFEGQPEEVLAAFLADGAQLDAEPQVDEQGLLAFTIKQELRRIAFKVAAVPPHEMRVDKNARWGGEPNAIGQVTDKPRFELEEMGFDLDGIGGDKSPITGERDLLTGHSVEDDESELHDSHKLYEYAELYFKLDVDGDGIAEWTQLCLINGTLVSVEQVDDHPFADICLMPRPHAYFGDCPADRAFEIQKAQTNLSRSLFDNITFATNQRTYINTEADVNIDDLLDNRPGGIVRGKGIPANAITPLPTMGIPAPAWQMQEWLAGKLENRTGWTRYNQGMDADSLNKTATGVSIITSKADQRVRLMTRFAAQGVRKMFLKLLKLATRHQDAEDWFEVNGEWLPVKPTEWRDQFTMSINVGLGHGTKEQQMQRLMAMVPLMQMGLQVGVVRPQHIAQVIHQAATVNEFKNPEEFADQEPAGLPNPQQFQQMQQEMQQTTQERDQLKQQVASKDGELQLKGMELQIKARELDHKEAESARNFDLQAQASLRSDQEAALKGAETEQRLRKGDDEDARLDALEAAVGQISEVLGQLLQPPPDMDAGMGMDAPAAPIEGFE